MKIDITQFSKPCSCGRPHTIVVKDLIIEKGAIRKLPDIISEFYNDKKCIVMICDENTYKVAGEQVESLLSKTDHGIDKVILNPDNLHANEHGVALAEEALRPYPDADLFLAVGSGTIHDITRYHAFQKKIPFISIPTAASVDGFVSVVAAMTWNGCKVTIPAVAPERVVADTDIFSKAPLRLTAAGVGDLLGKYTCLADWKIAHLLTDEYICEEMCQLEYTALDKIRNAADGLTEGDETAYEDLMYGLMLSGLAMQMIGNSRPASGTEHHMSHMWEMELINDYVDYYHGEKVAVGTVLSSDIYHKAAQKMKEGNFRVKNAMDVEHDLIRQSIRREDTYETIVKENDPNPLANIDSGRFLTCKDEIIRIIEEVPGSEELITLLKKVSCVHSLEDIGLPADFKEKTARLSPYVRNRLTFMRALKFFDFYEEVIQ